MKKLICIILMLLLIPTNVFGKDDETRKYKQPYKLLGTVTIIAGISMIVVGTGRMQSEVVDVYPDGTEVRNDVETTNRRNRGQLLVGTGCMAMIFGIIAEKYKVPTEKEFKGVVMKAAVGFNKVGLSFNF